MKKKITCIVVDDDDIDRHTIMAFLEGFPSFELIGSYSSSSEALTAAKLHAPDVLFLDIDMPVITGLQLREQLLHIPVCVFITSYPDYALEAFEMKALDFLVKPFIYERFSDTITRIEEYLNVLEKAALLDHTLGADAIFIKDGHKEIKLQLHEILYFEAMSNYTSLVTTGRKYAVLSPLSKLIQEQSFSNFIRIHRSYAVQKHFITRMSSNEVWLNDIALPVGRVYKEALKSIKI